MKLDKDADQSGRIASLFHALVDLDEPQRSMELHRRCSSDPELAQKVIALLRQDTCDADGLAWMNLSRTSINGASSTSGAGCGGEGFQPHRLLGWGPFASVMLARRHSGAMSEWVAVKVLMPMFQAEVGFRACIWREIAALNVLRHPLIPRLVEHGQTLGGTPWLATQYIRGRSLLDHARHFQLSMQERIRLFCRLLGALAHAHECGIAHGDFKNSNTLVSSDNSPYLIDFGACFNRSARAVEVGHNFPLALTPSVAAPEQAAGEPPNSRTDVYCAGLLLERLMTLDVDENTWATFDSRSGRAKSASRSESSRCLSMPRNQPSAVSAKVRVSSSKLMRGGAQFGDVGSLIKKAKSKDPFLRYRDASEFRAVLMRLVRRLPST